MRKLLRWLRRHILAVSITSIVLIASLVIPLPYYIFLPGSAEPIAPRITVEGGDKSEKGAFMLTTVLTISVDNIYYWLYGKLAPGAQFVPKQQVSSGISNADYLKVLRYMMDDSQTSAKIAAMHYLGKPVQVNEEGVEVGGLSAGSKAADLLRVGDLITSVNGSQVKNPTDLMQLLSAKSPGDQVVLSIKRAQNQQQVTVPLIQLPAEQGVPARAGLGISPLALKTAVIPEQIQFKTDDIGGPSAGLMFTLEIIAQLTKGDLTKGHLIAGTGTISPDGSVGQIGGIDDKIVAATNSHAAVFFLPKDQNPADTNQKIAFQEAQKIHSPMKLVPVATLSEAMDYLKSMQ